MLNCRVGLKTGTSKTGNTYLQLEVYFPNGYVFRTFLNNEQAFIIKSMFKEGE